MVIMAAGASSRMNRSFQAGTSFSGSKSMIPVGPEGRPFLDYLLLNAAVAGYRDVVIVVAAKALEIRGRYANAIENGIPAALRISFAEQIIPAGRKKPSGTADALLCALKARPDWRGKKFTVCNSDNLYSPNALQTMLESKYENAMIAYDSDSLGLPDEKIASFAFITKDADNNVLDIVEKPDAEIPKKKNRFSVSMNIFRFDYDMIFPILEQVPFDPVRDEKEMAAAIKIVIELHPGSLCAIPLSEPVPDLTARKDIDEIREYISRKYPVYKA